MPLFSRQSKVLEVEEVRLTEAEPGDHERFSHYVKKDKVVESAVTGKAITALCGKKWIPSRDPQKFPICPTCKELHDSMQINSSHKTPKD